ncbi:MAG: sigma-54-dependent Fis family transcriptional regulator [Calditrichaeota bacterium]|nr:sigma-54-dependent Fis family transcriptional regulator [Calditrichota bacterium]
MKENFKILVTDDDAKILFAFKEVLQKDGHEYLKASTAAEGLLLVETEKPDIIFMDINMPGMDGLQALQQIKHIDEALPVVIITGEGTMQTAIKAMQYGAFQYLLKPLSIKTIRDEIARVAISIESYKKNYSFGKESDNRYQLIGNDPQMHEIYKMIGSVSTTDNHTNVLITGETGTGKELIARAIHSNSINKDEPFIAINCTALPENLLESELFGHEKGAFTGAYNRKIGKFEQAAEGTIFLDEIGDLSLGLQKKLLRVLQEREFERLGENGLIPVKARFITATNQDLSSKIKNDAFRKDLYYRLNVVNIKVPPLRNRKTDIIILANFFLARYARKLGKQINLISDGAMAKLEAYDYPGNIRELENIIERAVMLSRSNVILPYAIANLSEDESGQDSNFLVDQKDFNLARDTILNNFEKQFISARLKETDGNVSKAAKIANMSRQNFHRLLEKHKIKAH